MFALGMNCILLFKLSPIFKMSNLIAGVPYKILLSYYSQVFPLWYRVVFLKLLPSWLGVIHLWRNFSSSLACLHQNQSLLILIYLVEKLSWLLMKMR